MARKVFSCKALLFLDKILNFYTFVRAKDSNIHSSHFKDQKLLPLNLTGSDLSNKTLIFDVEAAVFKSSSMFPYFMLVAFEAGGLVRALALLLLYPFIRMAGEEMKLKIMVMVCFFGLKRERFQVGTTVLPKFFLEDVGYGGFEVLMKCGKKVGVSNLPRVMVEEFLKEYLQIDFVVGRELKVFNGYYVGLMEDKRIGILAINETLGEHKMGGDFVGLGSFMHNSLDHYFSHCKDIYLMNEDEKDWQTLPREKYPKPMIFHDGRLAFKPTPLATLAMFIWIPFGVILFMFRILIGIYLPYKLHPSLMAFTGMKLILSGPTSPSSPITTHTEEEKPEGVLYVCNHKTLLDPVFVAACVKPPVNAVTYSISRFSEMISPIRTIRLTRDRERDARTMKKLLSQGSVVVCPEGTTCREPYLLRFSPLFAELSNEMVPMAIDVRVSMFYGTTASGVKSLDPVFFLMNPYLTYSIKMLDKRPGASTSTNGERLSSLEVANQVQREIGKALGFECTNLTRQDKYRILVGKKG